jgi:putative CocE/NonD family hydrolase
LQCDLLYAAPFARRGYVVLTYTCRGWGGSGDQVRCAAPDKELCDLEDMIDWLTDPAQGFPVDADRIGITGISYGGGHSFLAATRDERIKAAAPMNGWTDLYYSLLPNDCWKAPWSVALFLGGIWGHRFDPRNDLVRWLWTFIVEWNPKKLRGELEARSAIHDVDKVKCPMFIVHSWNDDLFEPNQVLDFYSKLNVPKRLHISNGLHGLDPGRGDYLVPNSIWDEARRWFDYWLKDDKGNGADSEPQVTFFQPWNKEMGTAENWPPEGFADVAFYLKGAAAESAGVLSRIAPEGSEPAELIINNTVSSLQSSGPAMVRLNTIGNMPIPGVPFSVPGDSLAFTTEPFTADTALVGAPRLTVYASSSTHECQLNALLYDVSPRGFCRLVTHSAMMKSEMSPGQAEEYDFELIACAHRFKAGHRARLVLCAADPMFVFPSLVPSKYRVHHDAGHTSTISLPLMAVTE